MTEEIKFLIEKAVTLLENAVPDCENYAPRESGAWHCERFLIRERLEEILQKQEQGIQGEMIYAQVCKANITPAGTLDFNELNIPLSILLDKVGNDEELTFVVYKTSTGGNKFE